MDCANQIVLLIVSLVMFQMNVPHVNPSTLSTLLLTTSVLAALIIAWSARMLLLARLINARLVIH